MNIKKWNARLSILTFALLIIHQTYQLCSYIMFFYNPALTSFLGRAVATTFIIHAILSIICVIALRDSRNIEYKRLNIRTLIQRISAVVIMLLLPVHIMSFGILGNSVGSIGYVLTEAGQIAFFGALFTHAALSFSNAFVTLGLLSDINKKRIIDRVVAVICAVLFIAVSCVITVGHIKIFTVR